MLKRLSIGWLAFVLLLTLAAPVTHQSTYAEDAGEVSELEADRTLFSLTETRTVNVKADLSEEVDVENLEFLFGGKPLEEWRKWSGGSNYNGDPFITVIEDPEVSDSGEVTATLEFGLLYNTSNLSNRTIRTQYQQFIGDYELALMNTASGETAATMVKLNVYDEFLFYEELMPAIDEVFNEAADLNDRYLEYQKAGESVEGRDIHFVILARDEGAVDKYLDETLPQALEDPAGLLEQLEDGTMGDYQVPIWFNNIHPDEVEGVDAQVELLKKFALEDEVSFVTTDEDGSEYPVSLDVDEVLDDVIFLYMFTSNPDGRVENTRGNANGFDLNRDNAYQTQVETQQVNELIAKWTPLSFVDLHGYVNGFLIEPTTPPHNPNFEYDLLINNMIDHAHTMGRTGVGESDLTSYFIARLEWDSGWDDMSPAYTGMYAMLHGSLGHTIEVPTLSQNSLRAMVGVGLGSALYVAENKDELFKKQLEIFERGVNGEDNPAVDEYFVNAAGESIGRVRGEHDSFFPDYYVIPADEKEQKNVLEAYNMAEYLLRNGVKVEETTQPVTIDGNTYPKGTFVVPMNQAKRGLANAVLYEGDDVSDWSAMYDPIVVNFPDLRGFDTLDVRETGLFEGKTSELTEVQTPSGSVTGNSPRQVLSNNTNDTIRVVNALLSDGKTVEVATESRGRVEKGDYLVSTQDLRKYEDEYYFSSEPLGNGQNVASDVLSKPKVAVTGSAQLRYSMEELGFELVNQSEADVIVSDSSSFNRNQVAGKSYIGIGVSALSGVRNSGMLPGFNFDFTRVGHEGLVKAEVADHRITAGYENEEKLYITTGAWITDVPEGAEMLAAFSGDDDFYRAGWWPGNDGAKGQTMAFTADTEEASFTLFANELAFRAHTEHSHRLLANAVYASVTEETERRGNNGRGQGVAVSKENVDETRDNGKVTSKISQGEVMRAVQSSPRADRVTIASDRGRAELLEVELTSGDIEDLRKHNDKASIEITDGETSYLIPVSDLDIGSAAEQLGDAFMISIQVSTEEEAYSGRDLDNHTVNVTEVKVKAKADETEVDLNQYRILE
ncbi:M14 family metallopeptidase [Alteribacter keqinensis]|uniref:X-prolyl-dipeptidyl aminopeptidase n=1 Tax=Alteribacter keqinensis TaxID=2483800 RepID=A0A3M7TWV6_9BACI|nr:M14 family zinc carboxypeptidase [Alteribacter keqinensis]RNA69983.1 X-prolyl-dipeptidyl aminopeptidase [Alteribacter keqinensis]